MWFTGTWNYHVKRELVHLCFIVALVLFLCSFKALSAGCLADLRKVSIHVSFIAYDVKTECLSCFVYVDSVNSLLPCSRKVYQYEMFEIRSNN